MRTVHISSCCVTCAPPGLGHHHPPTCPPPASSAACTPPQSCPTSDVHVPCSCSCPYRCGLRCRLGQRRMTRSSGCPAPRPPNLPAPTPPAGPAPRPSHPSQRCPCRRLPPTRASGGCRAASCCKGAECRGPPACALLCAACIGDLSHRGACMPTACASPSSSRPPEQFWRTFSVLAWSASGLIDC